MSRRTAEANKAVREAWEKERLLVLKGEGTRDWTQEQQQSIIDKGKAYDDDGKAFEGHHMKSVETYPEYQGDPDNIQFLTREEHLDAHHGSFQQPTNGYYNPVIKETECFDDREPNPCPIIKLSNPLVIVENNADEATSNSISESDTSSETTGAVPVEERNLDSTPNEDTIPVESVPKPASPKKNEGRFRKVLRKGILKAYEIHNKANEFSENHPFLTLIVNETRKVVVREVKAEIENRLFNYTGSYEEPSHVDSVYTYTSRPPIKKKAQTKSYRPGSSNRTNSPAPKISESPSREDHIVQRTAETASDIDISSKKNYPETRSSPQKHTVTGHEQRYHTKDGIIWKKKSPFSRGEKTEENKE